MTLAAARADPSLTAPTVTAAARATTATPSATVSRGPQGPRAGWEGHPQAPRA